MKSGNCFFCDALLRNGTIEMDHFPIPERNGGISLVPICVVCHDMKDRFSFEDWPSQWKKTVSDDFVHLSRETKIWLAKSISIMSDVINSHKELMDFRDQKHRQQNV